MPPTQGNSAIDKTSMMNPNTWFVSSSNGGQSQTKCDSISTLFPLSGFTNIPTGEITSDYINGKFGITTATVAWDFERWLLGQMYNNPASFVDNSEAEQFYNSRTNTTIWQLSKGEQMLSNALSSPVYDSDFYQLCQDNMIRVDSISKLEQMEGVDTTTVNGEWQNSKSELLTQCYNTSQRIMAKSDVFFSQQMSNLQIVKSFINNIETNNTLESNYKTILLLKIKTCGGDIWNSDDSIAIRAIAYSCPDIWGDAVGIARSMLPLPESNNFAFEGDDPNCTHPRSNNNFNNRVSLIEVWPNPANNNLLISFDQPFQGNIDIINMSGNIIQSVQVLDIINLKIPTDFLTNGVYLLRFRDTQADLISTKKVSILH
jgi:hypothetical protein